MDASFVPQSSRGITDEEKEQQELDQSVSCFYSTEAEEDESSSVNSVGSSTVDDQELREDATSTSSSSSFLCPPSSSSSSSDDPLELEGGPPFEMSSLISLLPVKRGLSKHFDGKSQSFTSLANARSLEDLAKPERPYKKRLISCKSYGEGMDCHKAVLSPKASSRTITKKASSMLHKRRHSFLSHRPPPPPPPQG